MLSDIYLEKKSYYYSNVRHDLIKLMPNNPNQKVLELGAGGGSTLVHIKEQKLASEVVGIELFELEDSLQDHPLIDKMIFGNVESMPLDLQEEYFDVIICGDVLEHLQDPWDTVKKLSTYLKKGGSVIVSLPNFRQFNVLFQVFFKGNFLYLKEGIFDKTHLHFFCKQNMIELFTLQNYTLIKAHSNLDIQSEPKRRRLLNKITLRIFEQFLSNQYLVVCKKN